MGLLYCSIRLAVVLSIIRCIKRLFGLNVVKRAYGEQGLAKWCDNNMNVNVLAVDRLSCRTVVQMNCNYSMTVGDIICNTRNYVYKSFLFMCND